MHLSSLGVVFDCCPRLVSLSLWHIELDKLATSRETDLPLRELELKNIVLRRPHAHSLIALASVVPQLRKFTLDTKLSPEYVPMFCDTLKETRLRQDVRQPFLQLQTLSLGSLALGDQRASRLRFDAWCSLINSLPALEDLERQADNKDDETWTYLISWIRRKRPNLQLWWRFYADMNDWFLVQPQSPSPRQQQKGTKVICELGVDVKLKDMLVEWVDFD